MSTYTKKKTKCKIYVFVTTIFGGHSVFSPFSLWICDFQDIVSIVSIVLFQ
jgi:hypothetical protein